MSLKEVLAKSSIANATAAIILIAAIIYAVIHKDPETLKYLAAFASGYLFGKAHKGR